MEKKIISGCVFVWLTPYITCKSYKLFKFVVINKKQTSRQIVLDIVTIVHQPNTINLYVRKHKIKIHNKPSFFDWKPVFMVLIYYYLIIIITFAIGTYYILLGVTITTLTSLTTYNRAVWTVSTCRSFSRYAVSIL